MVSVEFPGSNNREFVTNGQNAVIVYPANVMVKRLDKGLTGL